MTSYASVERIEGKYVECELELIPINKSKPENFSSKKTREITILLGKVKSVVEKISEGDILVVKHFCGECISVCKKDDAEKRRRIDVFNRIMS